MKRLCPTCKKPALKKGNPFFPFCSERCKLIDLGKWATEQYSIPGPASGDARASEPVKKERESDEEN